jgi:predicted DNA binding CopG/RHH family protein
MRKEYDFSHSVKNPYARLLKKQITIRLGTDVIAYFKQIAGETGIPYQKLIDLYLRDCVERGKRPSVKWQAGS